ncbi:MAG: DHH family phosphoesterase [Bacteroidota bacterium]
MFCLDFNSLHRINEFESSVADAMGTKVMIDHHLEPTDFADLMYWDDQASSTAEMIYRLVVGLGDRDLLNEDMAYPLYTGLMTDTGSFRFTSTTPAVHAMAGHLLETGINITAIHDRVYSQFSPERLKFFGYCLLNCLHILPQYETAYIKLERQVFKDFNVKTGGTEGLVNYALGIQGIKMGVLISEHNELVKLSFRSREDVSAKDYAEHFDGGGHFYAAGGRSHTSLEETEQELLELLASKYQPSFDEKPQLT